MTERQDIDALLIGSLYGELSSTEEARLAAHLESHPADRTTLDNLTWARNAVRESRILQVQLEPPQSISALLLQEAHRRAPKAPDGERSWFQRFMRSFMLHPAMAAAAMLVLVVGIGGTLYLRDGDKHFASQTKAPSVATVPEEKLADGKEAAPAADPDIAQQPQGSAAAADNFAVQLDETTALDKKQDETRDSDELADAEGADKAAPAFETRSQRPQKSGAKNAPAKPKAKKPYLQVTTPDQAPKDFDDAPAKTASRGAAPKREDRVTVGGASGGAAPGAPAPQPGTVARPSPPPPATPTEAEQQKQDPLLAWAKQQHGRLIAQVKAGKCEAAAAIAVQISNRASAYYTANVENDRTIKSCMPYITAQREKEAERVQRAKATQRRAVEPAAPTSTK